jgi:DNA-binding response OmpR family regulator
MPKKFQKILICEDSKKIATYLSTKLEEKGYTLFTLIKEKDPAYVVNNIEKTVRDFQPDYILLDGLEGKWVESVEIARKAKPDVQ